ncbi:helicase/secretion neighborhood CpaE-like protein [Promicromonospora umidemergens]|uniref:Secretion/DNA translocation related CpaE-like protein n=1 Tax=Promicromonospora umidemergens TaxID=629679 RepID=A0ABP8XJT7_9MICO|nr:pilus assembly protein FlpE [Promicromonospora umidemergens]MCP2284913.1 helicase/secretion neighborhood CpaE-like protein [Promicromonospora umidemergens]
MVRTVGGVVPEPGRVIGVVGACGGAGASVVAACVAHGLRRGGERATLVDLDAHAPGTDLLLGADGGPGARWPDLIGARGEVEGTGVVAALPRWGLVPVLSGTASGPPPDDEVVLDVCRGLVRAGETLVLDLPRPGAWGTATRRGVGAAAEAPGSAGQAVRTLLARCEKALLVVPLTLPATVGAQRVRDALRGTGVPDVRLVVRGPAPGSVDEDDVSAALGLPVIAVMGRDAGLARAIERGEGPAMSHRGTLGRFAADAAGAL